MRSRIAQAIVVGILTGLAGAGVLASPLGMDLEEAVGLDVLFKVRGVRRPPSDVLVVSVDKATAGALKLPADRTRWPRSLYARLTERLAAEGAAVIAFDVFFEKARTPADDQAFARAISRAGNVVLCQFLKREKVPVAGEDARPGGSAGIVRLVNPVPVLAEAAAALAPLPLPKFPVKVNRYWAFDTQAGETPTLPVVAFHVYSGQALARFLALFEQAHRGAARQAAGSTLPNPHLEDVIRNVRYTYAEFPDTAGRMLEALRSGNELEGDEGAARITRSLIGLYGGANDRYLNYYGPPRTIPTVSCYRMLEPPGSGNAGDPRPDVRGKAVFVGLSELLEPDQKDGHYSVYSRPDGLDLCGTEIAATAFANLLEDAPVRPLRPPAAFAAVFFFGAAVGALCRLLAPLRAALAVAALGALYFGAAAYRFAAAGAWHPLVAPLLFQSSLGYVAAVLLRYGEARTERQAIRKALGYYLPVEVVDRLSRNATGIDAARRTVHGICLGTDAANYTALAESLAPGELASYMNAYYESVFRPVKVHKGIVSNVVADSMLALWVTTRSDEDARGRALLAALDIAGGAPEGDGPAGTRPLVTRVGLHAGEIVLGNLGAVDHFEYRPVGDIVNTATRIEGLNKPLGTRILASAEVVRGLDGFLTREVGTFLLPGKARAVTVHDVVCRMETAHPRQKDACALFAAGLDAFRARHFEAAIGKFRETMRISGKDGPSGFYIEAAGRYAATHLVDEWNGVICMETK